MSNQIDRFSTGFFEYSVNDKALLQILNSRVPKHLRGNELKNMALLYLIDKEPELFNTIRNNIAEESGIGVRVTVPVVNKIEVQKPIEEVVVVPKVDKVEKKVEVDEVVVTKDEPIEKSKKKDIRANMNSEDLRG